jgi:hypothetical protein
MIGRLFGGDRLHVRQLQSALVNKSARGILRLDRKVSIRSTVVGD